MKEKPMEFIFQSTKYAPLLGSLKNGASEAPKHVAAS
jgi:hypothetical protein